MVSILTPFRNAAPWLSAMIESVQEQSLTTWELILVDDHSTDSAGEIAAKYAAKDSRIRVVENDGKGIIPALQKALSLASGDAVTRMDADDVMPAGRLKRMYAALKSAPLKSVVTGKVRYFSDKDVSPGYRKYEAWLNERIAQKDHFQHLYRECVIASPNWMTRKADLLAHGIFAELQYPEDYDMVFRWFRWGFTIVPVDEVTLLWREHPARTSRNSRVYDQESFFKLKISWFVQLHQPKKTVGILGAGSKGKLCAALFQELQVNFRIYDLNFAKIRLNEYVVENPALLSDEYVMLARYPEDRSELEKFVAARGYVFGKTAFWV